MASRPPDLSDDEARKRWLVIQLMRVGGVAFAILGIMMARDVVNIGGDDNRLVGYAFIVIGLLDAFVVPQYLARKWRTPPQ
jgi:hypothetical protein